VIIGRLLILTWKRYGSYNMFYVQYK